MPQVVISIAISFAISTVLGVISSLFSSGPKRAETPKQKGRKQLVRSSIEEHRVVYGTSMESGPLTFIAVTGDENQYLHMVIPLAAHEVEGIDSIWVNDVEVTNAQIDGSGNVISGKYNGFMRIRKHLGTDTQAADSALVSDVPNWTTNHRGRGIAYIYMRLLWDLDIYPQGIPNVRAIVRGRLVWDLRTDPGDPSVKSFSNNAALCQLDYLMSDFGFEAPLAEVHEASWVAAANSSDEAVTLKAGGTQARYTCDGSFQVDQKPLAVMEDLLSASAGSMVYQQGTFRGYVGEATTATGSLDESDLRDTFVVTPQPSLSDSFNAIRGTYVNAGDIKAPYTLTDFPPITNATYEAEDNGERVFTDIELQFTTNVVRAQRISGLFLHRSRQGIIVSFPAKLSGLKIATWDVRTVSLAVMSWAGKEFRIIEWSLSDDGGIDLVLQEEASAIYDWDPNDEITVDPAPDTNFPDPFTVTPPTGLVLTSGTDTLFIKSDGTVVSRIKATWTAPADQFVTVGGKIEVQFKKTADSTWIPLAALPGDAVEASVWDVEDGVAYDLRVRSVSSLGVKSDLTDPWSATSNNHTVIGKIEVPPNVSTFVVATLADGTRKFEWTMDSLPADVRSGGGYQIRYSSGGSLTWASGTKLHDGLLISSPFETNELAAGQYTFGIKAFDTTDNESASDIQITATLSDPRLREVLLQRVEHTLLWPGTLTDCFITTENTLEAVFSGSPADDWASLPSTWNALADTWRGIVGSATPLRYETPVMDVGADSTFTPLVSAETVETPTIEMRTHTEAEGSDLSAEPYIAVAQVVGERYTQIRISVAGTTPVVITMTTLLDGEVIVEDFEDINTATEGGAFFNSIAAGHFEVGTSGDMSAITQAQITAIQSVSAPHTWTLISKAGTVGGNPAAEFKIFNDSGTLVDAVIDLSIKGPKA